MLSLLGDPVLELPTDSYDCCLQTLAVQLEACLESDSLLRFSTFGAVLFGAVRQWTLTIVINISFDYYFTVCSAPEQR